MNDQSFTVKEFAKLIDVNAETVRRWIRSGRVKAQKESNKDGYLIPADVLGQFLAISKKYAYAAAIKGPIRVEGFDATLIACIQDEIASTQILIDDKKVAILNLVDEIAHENARLNELNSILSSKK